MMVVANEQMTDMPILHMAERLKPDLMARQLRIIAAAEAAYELEERDMRSRPDYPKTAVIDDQDLVDVRNDKSPVISPRLLKSRVPLTVNSARTTQLGRGTLSEIYAQRDGRLVVALGECAVYDPELTLENTALIRGFQSKYPNLFLLQRVFLEKPRTPKGKGEEMPWKGFFYDPDYDKSDDINKGAIASRLLVVRITDAGQPIIKEQLNAVTPQYTDDAVTQDNIGARNVRDQKAMEYGSATSAHLANKNSIDGDIEAGVQASASSHGAHSFLGIDSMGFLSRIAGEGNPLAHVLLRGGNNGPNHSADHVESALALMVKYNLPPIVSIDASHGNSGKKAENQPKAVEDIARQIAAGQIGIVAVHLETNVEEGAQKREFGQKVDKLPSRQSITDECAGPDSTDEMLANLDEAVAKRAEILQPKTKKARKN